MLRAYQVGGRSNSNKLPPWRLFDVSKISNLKMAEQSSQAPREGYKKGDKDMICMFAEI